MIATVETLFMVKVFYIMQWPHTMLGNTPCRTSLRSLTSSCSRDQSQQRD